MKKIARYAILILFMALTFLGLFSTPESEFYSSEWAVSLIVSKLLGLAFGVLTYVLACDWHERGML